ncbi:MAG: helicase-exonuclease AddAB subunit AddA [Lactobacillus sp.]|jgi:ATP-dependent helicase/nuclease subunit A|nr:helicase-exonuclease AddAB subunit AddA [Lactobacillus sp.]
MTNFTPAQTAAIETQGKNLLVSASAGSGKTTVLVERVIYELLHGQGIDHLLVITFTKAAAAEMKIRIKQRLLDMQDQLPAKRRWLQEQILAVDTANISTIDAFCLDLIKRFYYVIKLDPSFSILTDETQQELLKEKALQQVEENWLAEQPAAFKQLFNNFAGDRNFQQADDLLLDLYEEAMAKADYQAWLKSLPARYELDEDQLVQSKLWQTVIKPQINLQLANINEQLKPILDDPLLTSPDLQKVAQNFQGFAQNWQAFTHAVDSDQPYDQQRSLLQNCRFLLRTAKSKKWDEATAEFYEDSQTAKKAIKEAVLSLLAHFYAQPESDQIKALQAGQQLTQTIVAMETDFIAAYNQLKRQQTLLDYGDLEQMAYQILTMPTTQGQQARRFYQEKFAEILVDECQDINGLQDALINRLHGSSNHLFFVGDVKQSIYGFRQARPELFLQKYREYQASATDQCLHLAENFRSSPAVTKLVNQVFNGLMTKDFGGLDYEADSQLLAANHNYDQAPQAAELLLTPDNQQLSLSQLLIQRIQQLQAEHFQVYDGKLGRQRPLQYSDIAILTRSRSDNLEIMSAFAQAGIPLLITDAQNYFQTFELSIVLNYLKIIDNPEQDIPLVAVLRSPIFSFSTTDLAQIRVRSPRSDFYTAVSVYSLQKNELGQRCQRFLQQLNDLRTFARQHRISELIWSLYSQTHLLEIMTSLPNGRQRRVNLENLYERASSFESAGFKGLYQFIRFLNRMQSANKDLAEPLLSSEAGNAVKLLTIHGAKGLQFPIVFYTGLTHKFPRQDLQRDYVFDQQSLGLTIAEPEFKVDTLVKTAAAMHQQERMLAEESRITYVALTRAEQKLILVGQMSDWQKTGTELSRKLTAAGKLPAAEAVAANQPLDLIGGQLQLAEQVLHPIEQVDLAAEQSPFLLVMGQIDAEQEKTTQHKLATQKLRVSAGLLNRVHDLFSFKYPNQAETTKAAYQSVSDLKRRLDPDERELENSHLHQSTNRYLQPIETKPSFLYQDKFTGAQIGTAAHLVLQYYPYDAAQPQPVSDTIKHLIETGKLNAELAQDLPLDALEWFVNSDFAKPFWQAPEKLHREVAFSGLLPAKRLFADVSDETAKILLHGTIDGYFETPTGIVLFDYKTDQVDPNQQAAAIEKIKQRYRQQLNLYAQALTSFSGRPVIGQYLILLAAQKCVKLE